MVAFARRPAMIPSLTLGARAAALVPTGGALVAAIAGGGTIAALPVGLLERLVWTSGVATLLPAAQPPLGPTARVLLALGAALVAGAVVWSALFLLFGPEGLFGPRARPATPTVRARRPGRVRRGDAHPDAPPPRPMTAADLGTPLMEVAPTPPRVQPLPVNLDQPLAAFDPAALPETPRLPAEPLAPLAPRWAAGERIETFELDRPAPQPPAPVQATAPRKPAAAAPSIDSLLRRLEESAGRRVAVR